MLYQLNTHTTPHLSLSPSQILGFVDTYVFYADLDVMFLRDISLATFAPLPAFFAVGVEDGKRVAVRSVPLGHSALTFCDPMPIDGPKLSMQHRGQRSTSGSALAGRSQIRTVPCTGEVDYGNAGVMLLHVERMRRTHAEFVRFIFSEEVVAAGMDHGVYGPADQGAYNRFFAGYFDVHLKASWNWKPYWGHLDYTGRAANVSLVHFHGPKPHEYFAHEASKKSTHKGRGRDPFRVLFDLCDMRDRKSAALIPRQPGCMAFSHRYREELAKVGPLVRSAVVA